MTPPSLVPSSPAPAPVAGPAVLSRTAALAAEWQAHAERQRAINPADPTAATLTWCAEQMLVAVTEASRDDEELTPAQYGAQSHVGRTGSTIRRWCQRGHLPCRLVGRDYRIRRATPVPAFAVAEASAA